MKRKSITTAMRISVFDRYRGACHICGLPIDATKEPWDVEHPKAIWLGGADDESNMRPAHVRCHAPKSAGEATLRAKGTRVRARHLGIRRKGRPMIGAKASGWQKTFNHGWIRR